MRRYRSWRFAGPYDGALWVVLAVIVAICGVVILVFGT